VYGLFIHDMYIIAPNVLALAFGVLQLLLLAVYGSKPVRKSF